MSIKSLFSRNRTGDIEPVNQDATTAVPVVAENPYLSARRTWNWIHSGINSSRQSWQIIGILCLLITLASVGGIIYIGSLSKFIPYVIEVDKHGNAIAVGPVDQPSPVDKRTIEGAVNAFIVDSRTVTPDVILQRRAIMHVYAMLNKNDSATQKMTDWFTNASPFKRAEKEMVSIEIETSLPQTPDTWQVDWIETVRDRHGVVIGIPSKMKALITIYFVPPTPQTKDEDMRANPFGLFVSDFSWSKHQ